MLGGSEYLIDCLRFLIYCLRRRPIVHVQWLCIPVWDVFYFALLRLLGIKMVHTMHNVLPHDREHWGNRILWGAYYRAPQFLILHGYSFLAELKRQGLTIPKTRLALVPYGLALQYLPAIGREQARRELGWGSDEKVMVFVGSVHPYKGLDILLDAMEGIEEDKRLRLVLAVHWKESDRFGYEQQINRLAERFTVEVQQGVPSTEKMRQLACGADMWVLPYRSASHSFVASIAQRYGTGMVVTNVGELPHVLGESLRQWVVAPGDIQELGRRIQSYLALPEAERQKIGQELHAQGFQKACWEVVAKKTANLYDILSIPTINRV
jgi:glycosyltransferase involved in cell wall biosynthesis